jgi:Arginase family
MDSMQMSTLLKRPYRGIFTVCQFPSCLELRANFLNHSLGYDHGDKVSHNLKIPKCLRPDRIAYIGLRDVDPEEKEILREHNIAAFSMYHVDKYGIGKVVEMALDRINPNRDRPVSLLVSQMLTFRSTCHSMSTLLIPLLHHLPAPRYEVD